MKVILLQTVEDVGDEGEIREVADGFARNFLFPKHLAIPATDGAVRAVAERTASVRQEAERELRSFQALAAAVDGYELVVTAAATPDGNLYGSVDAGAIAHALRDAGFAVEDDWVILPEPIKQLGEQEVRLRFPHGLEVEVTVIVEAENK